MPIFQESDPGITDNEVLDEFEVPFGEWMDQSVDWIDVNLDWLLDAIRWPFNFLLTNLVNDFLIEISWVWIVLAFFVLGSLARNINVGVFSALALAGCGLLGNAYWIETARTIGFIFVAVLLCVIIGIPLGVASGRIDGFWKVVRPILDAMQVVHSFVYMLPFIFFFGIGPVSATMVTMVFALPPLIRLTNLGIRQVPEDVVEASRAYGAPEWRVLADVQLPLARPAIMTGLNQTLLLAISMLGIAAIMGAGGLGQLLFRALSNQDVAFATSGGLAFFLVAVVLDRISQPEDSDSGNLFHRIRLAWAHRSDPEVLVPAESTADESAPAAPHFAPVDVSERPAMALVAGGSILGIVSVFLTWANDGGKLSGYGRRDAENVAGESFSGLSAEGGSWFAYIVLGIGLFMLAAVVVAYLSPGKGPRWMTADGVVIAGIGVFIASLAYLLASAPPNSGHGTGIGVWLALIGSLLAAGGGIMWIRIAPHSPLHPLSADVNWGRIVGVFAALLLLIAAAFSGWSFDGRQDVVVSPELQAQIDQLQQDARDRPDDAGAIAAELSGLMASAQQEGVVVTDGFSGDGPGFGIWTLIGGLIALGAALPAIGLFNTSEHQQWEWSAITAGTGAGIALVSIGWIATQVRSADPNYVSGVGSFVALIAGAFIVASTTPVLSEFRRTLIYDEAGSPDAPTPETADQPEQPEQVST